MLAGAIVAAAVILSLLVRYSDKATPQGLLYLTDRWTGRVWTCPPAHACIENTAQQK
jgi:hypothetical protein